jgi:hypothetical protein
MTWLLAAVAFATHLQAGKVSLQWIKSADPGVTGYRLRVLQNSSGSASIVDAGNTNIAIVDNLLEGQTYTISVTAYTGGGIESDPSNFIYYTVAFSSGPTFALQFTNFTHATAQYSPHGTMTSVGEAFPAGTVVTLTATPDTGYVCSAWMVNGLVQPNPTTITMNQNTSVRPAIKKRNGSANTAADPSQTAVRVTASSGGTMTISIGPEMGAWLLEATPNFRDWTQIATGLTSDQVSAPTTQENSYFRLRQAQLSSFP